MINSSLFYNSIEPSFILRDMEVLDYNPAIQKILHLKPVNHNLYQFYDLLPHEQTNGSCTLKIINKVISSTYKNGNHKEKIHFKTGLGLILQIDVLFTLFYSDKQERLIFCACKEINEVSEYSYEAEISAIGHAAKQSIQNGIDVEHLLLENKRLQLEVNRKIKKEEACKKTEEKFKILSEATPAAIMQFDTSFRHIYVNSKVKDLMGIDPFEFLGNTPEEMNYPLPLVDLFQNSLKEIILNKKEGKKEFILPNGKFVEWHLVPVFNDNGKVKSIISALHDITSLKEVEDEVRESREKLSDAMKMANLSTWEYDLNSRKMILSTGYCDLFGIKNTKRKITGEFLLKNYVFHEDHDIIINAYNQAVESKELEYKNYIDYRGLRNGEIINILASIRVIKNQLGIIVKCYGTVQDITTIWRNEQELQAYRLNLEKIVQERTLELKKSEANLNDALRLVSLGTWEFDFTTKKYNIGDEVITMMYGDCIKERDWRFSIEDFFNHLHPHDLQHLQKIYSNILKIKDTDYVEYMECRFIRPDGEIRNLYISLKIVVDKNGWHLKHYGTIQDITNIRRTEAENERLIAISEATSDIIVIANDKGGILYLNKAGKQFFGVEKNVELSYLDVNSLQKSKSKRIFKKTGIGQAIRKGIWSGENIIYDKDGKPVPVSQVIIAHQSENGSVDCYSTMLRDISRQKNIEQDLIYKNNELDTFVYRASHDLRGPIASLLGLHTIVKYEISDPLSLKYFEMYNQQILRLNNIIISLIEISRIRDRDAVKVNISFSTIVDECISSFINLPNFENIDFKIKIDPQLAFKSDISIITTIMQNLIENSIKYSKPDQPSTVTIEIKALTDAISIKVVDNGIGIDSAIQGKIFNMFFRGTEQGMGSGLGLYILKNAVDKLKGQIILDSILHKGTTFQIILPN